MLHLRELSPCLRLLRESSTEPMDTDDARRASVEIYRRIRQQAGLSRSGSVGDVTLQPAPLGIMTQGKLVLRRGMPEQTQAGQPSAENPETTAGATGGDTLLNIPPCSMAEGPGEQSQSLFRPPMSDPEVDLEPRRGARPKVTGSQATQTKKGGGQRQPLQRSRYSRCGGRIFIYHWEANPGSLRESLGGPPL